MSSFSGAIRAGVILEGGSGGREGVFLVLRRFATLLAAVAAATPATVVTASAAICLPLPLAARLTAPAARETDFFACLPARFAPLRTVFAAFFAARWAAFFADADRFARAVLREGFFAPRPVEDAGRLAELLADFFAGRFAGFLAAFPAVLFARGRAVAGRALASEGADAGRSELSLGVGANGVFGSVVISSSPAA